MRIVRKLQGNIFRTDYFTENIEIPQHSLLIGTTGKRIIDFVELNTRIRPYPRLYVREQ